MHDPVALKSNFACIILELCLILLEVSDSVDSAKSSVQRNFQSSGSGSVLLERNQNKSDSREQNLSSDSAKHA